MLQSQVEGIHLHCPWIPLCKTRDAPSPMHIPFRPYSVRAQLVDPCWHPAVSSFAAGNNLQPLYHIVRPKRLEQSSGAQSCTRLQVCWHCSEYCQHSARPIAGSCNLLETFSVATLGCSVCSSSPSLPCMSQITSDQSYTSRLLGNPNSWAEPCAGMCTKHMWKTSGESQSF